MISPPAILRSTIAAHSATSGCPQVDWTALLCRPLVLSVLFCLASSACVRATVPSAPAAAAPTAVRAVEATYTVGLHPRAIAVADLNSDGFPEVAVANSGDGVNGTVTLLFGARGGGLVGPTAVTAGPQPSDIDAADLDRDGDIDLVVANHDTPLVTVLWNDGSGRFDRAQESSFDTGARPHVHGLAIGDFDGDGWIDVAVDSADSREVRVLMGTPNGLSPAIAVSVGTMPYFRIGTGDVVGGPEVDVVVPGHSDSTVRAVSKVDGRLGLADWLIHVSAQPWMVATGDVNGDGLVDVAVMETDRVSVWLATSNGYSEAPGSPHTVMGVTEIAVGDLDGDHLADIVAGPWEGQEVTVIPGDGSPARAVAVCERPIGLSIHDLDGDGRGELLAACATGDSLVVKPVR
jgi:hypothetical protein